MRNPPAGRAVASLLAACVLLLGLTSIALGEANQQGNLRVSFQGRLTPHTLPRTHLAPIKVAVGTRISSTTKGSDPPQLSQISIAINRNGRFEPRGLPICRLREIQPTTTADALAACRSSLVGEGTFSAKVLLSGEAPFPSTGKVYAFNSVLHGHPAILAHVYGTDPYPASYILPFVLTHTGGTYGTVLRASLRQATSDSGYITGLQLTLGRTFRSHGKLRSYLSASCPAPRGVGVIAFPFARATFNFGKRTLTSILNRSCRAVG